MFFSFFDLILLFLLFLFIAFGFVMGLIETLGSILGLVFGVWMGALFFQDLGNWLAPYLFGNNHFASVVAFVIIFFFISKSFGFLFFFLSKILRIFSIIPFFKSLNRIAGAIFGALEGIFVIGLILLFITQFPFSSWIDNSILESRFALIFMAAASIFTPLLPKLIIFP